MVRKKTASLPAVHVSSLLFICALLPALLFKGPQIEFFAITQIVLVIWLGWIVLHSHGSGLRIPKTSLALCLTLFWLWLALSLTWSLAPNISVINFWWVGSLVLVFWLYTLTPDRDALWSHAAAILLVIGLVLALMGIYQVLVLEQHARSVFETRNTHAAFLNLVALPASAYFLQTIANKAVPRHYSVILGTVLFFLFLSIFLTASRGASLSLAISVGLLTVLTRAVCSPARPGSAVGAAGGGLSGHEDFAWRTRRALAPADTGFAAPYHLGILLESVAGLAVAGHRPRAFLSGVSAVPQSGGQYRRLFRP